MNIKRHIPNILTCGNLVCGCLAIVSAFNGDLVFSAYLVGIAAVLDFFDGFAARILNVGGEMGKQLDSLADMVTFGVVPGVVMYQLIFLTSSNFNDITITGTHRIFVPHGTTIAYIAFLITIFSCVRLAKFNIDTRQAHSFIGVPTPANSILICSIPLINTFQSDLLGFNVSTITGNIYFLITLTIIMSYLLIAEMPLFALKFKNFEWPDNKLRYLFLIISAILLILFQYVAIPFIIFLYIILSIVNNIATKTQNINKPAK